MILDHVAKLMSILVGIATILAVIGAYYRFVKGRIFRPRLQPEASAKLVRTDDAKCVLVEARLRNVGAASIDLTREGTAIDLYSYEPEKYRPRPHLAIWTHLTTFRIFEDHKSIESGETIIDAQLIPVSQKPVIAFKVEMNVNAYDISFKTRTVIDCEVPQETKPARKEETL